jgi:hypothetical protein
MSSYPLYASKYTNNESSKMIASRMIRSRKIITYNNTLSNSIINKILGINNQYDNIYNINFDINKDLILKLGNDLYKNYLDKILRSSSFNDKIKNDLIELYENILSSLTEEEQKVAGTYIQEINETNEIIENFEEKLLENPKFIYYCKVITVGVVKNLIITNYRNGDILTPGEKYLFDLQDQSNAGTELSFSKKKYGYEDVPGLYLIGTPGTPGSYLVYEPDLQADYYKIYVYNKLDSSRKSYLNFGYVYEKFIIEINYKSRGIIKSYLSFSTIDLQCMLPRTAMISVEYKGPKYIFEPEDYTFLGSSIGESRRYNLNRRYGLYYGTYYSLVTNISNPMTILNKGKEHLIQIYGEEENKIEKYLTGLTEDGELDGSYNFYSNNIRIEVYGNFDKMTIYSYLYGFNFMENLLVFSEKCSINSTFKTNYEEKVAGLIECLYPETVIRFSLIDNQPFMTFNNNTVEYAYTENKVYGLYNGQYIIKEIPENHAIAFINSGKENYFKYFGNENKFLYKVGPDNKLYKYYYDTIVIQVYGDFGMISVYEFYDGYCGGKNLFQYTDFCEYETPWIPENGFISEPSSTTIVELDDDVVDFNIENINNYATFKIDSSHIFIDISNNPENQTLLDPNVKYGLNQGNYVLMDVPQSTPIAFLNKGVENKFNYDGYFPFKITSTGPDGFLYDFYYGNINLYVNGDFGRMSIYTLNQGFMNNGRNILIYDNNANIGLAIANYGTISYYPLLIASLNTEEPKEFYIDINVVVVELSYNNSFASYRFSGIDRNGQIDKEENNPSLTFFIGDVVYFNFSYLNLYYSFGIYEIKNLLTDPQVITNNLNKSKKTIKWTPVSTIQNYYYYRSENSSDLMFNTINILPNNGADLTPNIINITFNPIDITIENDVSLVSVELSYIEIEFSSLVNVDNTKNIQFVNVNDIVEKTLNITNITGNGTTIIRVNTEFTELNKLSYDMNYTLRTEDGFFKNIYLKTLENNNIVQFKTQKQ